MAMFYNNHITFQINKYLLCVVIHLYSSNIFAVSYCLYNTFTFMHLYIYLDQTSMKFLWMAPNGGSKPKRNKNYEKEKRKRENNNFLIIRKNVKLFANYNIDTRRSY